MNTTEKKQLAAKLYGRINNQHDQAVGVLIGATRERWGHCTSGSTQAKNWTGRPLGWDANHKERTEDRTTTWVEIFGRDEDGQQSQIAELQIVTETETETDASGETYKSTHATVYLDKEHFLDALLTDARGSKAGWCVVHRPYAVGFDARDFVWETHQPNLIEASLDAYCALVG